MAQRAFSFSDKKAEGTDPDETGPEDLQKRDGLVAEVVGKEVLGVSTSCESVGPTETLVRLGFSETLDRDPGVGNYPHLGPVRNGDGNRVGGSPRHLIGGALQPSEEGS